MNPLKNLSVIRKLVQIAAFALLVYGSSLGAYHLADKLTHALPALSCAFDHNGSDICALIPVQHQLGHRLGPVITSGGDILMGLMPTLITLGTFLFFFIFLNKAFCGWICPLGTFQEFMYMLGQKLGLQPTENVDQKIVRKGRPIKWFMLLFLIFVFPLLSGVGFVNHDLMDPFCKICPSRFITTLANGDASQLHVDTASTTTIVLTVIADFLFGLVIVLSLTVRQPFCRICPILALNAVFRKLGLLRLIKNASSRCDKCGLCAKACPMDIEEIHTEMEKKNVLFEDCTLCGRCVEFCPEQDVLQMKYTVIPVFSADPKYFKDRNKAQKKWEKNNLMAKLGNNRKPAGDSPA